MRLTLVFTDTQGSEKVSMFSFNMTDVDCFCSNVTYCVPVRTHMHMLFLPFL